MANVGRKWIAPVVIVAAFAASAIAYTRLPSLVTLPAEALLPFDVPDNAEPAPRWLAAFLVPITSVLIWLGFRFAPTDRAQRVGRWFFRNAPPEATSAEQFERFGKTYETIVLGVVALILGVHAGLLTAVFQRPVAAARVIGVTLALFMILVGNVMPRLRANWVAGVRTKRLLADPDLWRTTHRVFGAALVLSGLVTLIVTAVAPAFALLIGAALILVSCIVAFAATMRGVPKAPTLVAALAAVAAAIQRGPT
jgi:hypothetical protein